MTFGGVIQDPSRLVKRAGEFFDEFKQSQVQLAVSTVSARTSRWTPPPSLSFKLNFDAAIFQDGKASGFGAVIWNNVGEVMAALSASGPPILDSEEAEVLACRKALEFAFDLGFVDIVLEGDNSVVMAAVSSSTCFTLGWVICTQTSTAWLQVYNSVRSHVLLDQPIPLPIL